MIQLITITPNDWLTEEKLADITGYSTRKIRSFRERSWVHGRQWIFVATDGTPKENSEILYNLRNINKWFESQIKNQPRYKKPKPADYANLKGESRV